MATIRGLSKPRSSASTARLCFDLATEGSALHAAAVLAGKRCSNVDFGTLEMSPPFYNSSAPEIRLGA